MTNQKTFMNILIGGEAGQGLVTIGELLGKALVRAGYHILVTQDYQSRIRGGNNTFSIRVGTKKPLAPVQTVDMLLALDNETIRLHRASVAKNGLVIGDARFRSDVPEGIWIPFEDLGTKRAENIVALGVMGALLGVESGLLMKLLEDSFGKRHPESMKENTPALVNGYEWAKKQEAAPAIRLGHAEATEDRYMMNGNQALALGAMAAGLKFCAFYPMTPATSIPLTIAAHADDMGIMIEQAEDEIGAINMAIGASFAGAPSMVATSGGGFALMTEGVSLAGMTETPIVIVVGQRPGPATGLPTRTEQADLEFVLHAGHGEFPRAIFAPGSPESCFNLAQKAFHLAEASQGPVFILTDQFLADSYRSVTASDLVPGPTTVKAGCGSEGFEPPYLRYRFTETGVSPRLLPGASSHLVVADSDEHTEDGHITEDLHVRKRMVEKRLMKLCGIFDHIEPPTLHGGQAPETLLVTWGSTSGAAIEAATILNETEKRASVLHFDQIWPVNPHQFLQKLTSAGRVFFVEGNATGQFARLIRRETGFGTGKLVLRYDGLPITADYIIGKMATA